MTAEQAVSQSVAAPTPERAPADGSASPRSVEVRGLALTVGGFEGSLEQLVLAVQRGEVDVTEIPVAEITAGYRAWLRETEPRPDHRETADFLQLAARLVALKAARLLPDGSPDDEAATPEGPVDDPGARLAEYRLFRAAADALLTEAAEEGARSFLGLVVPEVIPVERLTIAPERLAAAFRAVLERIAEPEPLPVGAVTFSVEDKVVLLTDALRRHHDLQFERVFDGVGSRLEAVACFLAVLELLRRGLATVIERAGEIVVRAVA